MRDHLARDHLAVVVRGLHWYEFARVGRFDCRAKKTTASRADIAWWREPDQAR